MRLHGVFDGRLYATDYRQVLFERRGSGFDTVGRLPAPPSGRESLQYHLMTSRGWKPAVERVVGAFPTVTLHRFTEDDLLATAGPWLFTSHDGGRQWHLRRRLPRSSGPMGVLPSGVCYHDGTLLLGEYPLADEASPRVLRSEDHGRSWETELVLDDVRHVHAVQVDPYTGDRWLTTGDADEECRIGRLRDGDLAIVGGGSQQWRAVELVFTPSAILWGVDCSYVASNPIYRLDRDALESGRPTTTRVYEVADSVFYGVTLPVGDDEWVVFSTAAEATPDSTAPAARLNEGGTRRTGTVSVVAASSASEFTDWFQLARYTRRQRPVDRVDLGGRLPIASAYAFLVGDPARGLFVNPYNTTSEGGTIVRFPLTTFNRLGSYK